MSEVFCDEDGNEMHQSMSAHGDDCPMDMDMDDAHQAPKHHQAHDLGFACACSVDEAPVKTEAQAQLKHKVPVAVIRILDEDHTDQTETNAFQNPVSDALSPPPIYLLNETFLN